MLILPKITVLHEVKSTIPPTGRASRTPFFLFPFFEYACEVFPVKTGILIGLSSYLSLRKGFAKSVCNELLALKVKQLFQHYH